MTVIGVYVGHVSTQDRLYGFLHSILSDQLGQWRRHPRFRAFRLNGSNEVYGYEESHSHARIICKFYGPKFGWDRERAARVAYQEHEAMERLRGYDLVGSPHHVIRPLGVDPDTNCVIATEFYKGEPFFHAIRRATHHGDDAHLYWRLKALAYFLATQHNRSASGETVDFDVDTAYLRYLLSVLQRRNKIGQWDCDELLWLSGLWRMRPRMWSDRQVLLHGDATPANFLFGHGLDVAAIDLERTAPGDRMFDVGRVAGELQHAFMSATGSRHRAEPFIGHFLWEYSCHFPDREVTFASITSRVPYYMGLNLLRIARNDYVDDHYRRRLIRQAKRHLRAA
ncbi:aminoglycoside phosphotransferase (APT) family kinase protein [Gordonia amarae]|uniref:phosphotransferase n=1 Tax=Gordonia amarae TaxID=36821 RepID=UPI001FD4F98E|nr:phosphotransferase [Gordonia amarae]MCS3877845.1 aminoglycoside phosphotransferase (APT) family kinase protein [Gordonia amarae]